MKERIGHKTDEMGFKELIKIGPAAWRHLLSKKLHIIVAGIFGVLLGIGYAFFQPVKYTSKITFVVEESKSSGGSLASLAGQFGVDFGSGSSGGVFSGDNILFFLKSAGLVRQTLLTHYDSVGNITLADKYAEVTKLKEKWSKKQNVGAVDFSKYDDVFMPRKEDSLMQLIVSEIIESDLSVDKPDKKATMIELKVMTQDELLSKLFSERLLNTAIDRYIESKTKTKALNVAKLQMRADSLYGLLNSKTYAVASSQQNLIDGNPALRSNPIASEITSRDKTMVAMVLSEVVKNLELSKTMLSQETPIVQLVDQSTLPLPKYMVGKLQSVLLGGILTVFCTVLFLLLKEWVRRQLIS